MTAPSDILAWRKPGQRQEWAQASSTGAGWPILGDTLVSEGLARTDWTQATVVLKGVIYGSIVSRHRTASINQNHVQEAMNLIMCLMDFSQSGNAHIWPQASIIIAAAAHCSTRALVCALTGFRGRMRHHPQAETTNCER